MSLASCAGRLIAGISALLLLLLLVAGTQRASAHGLGTLAAETALLGRAHALEHERVRRSEVRALRRWRALPRAERSRIRLRQERRARASAQRVTQAAGAASVTGRWTVAPFPLPNYAIHAAVLPTGKVLFYGYPPLQGGKRPNFGQAALWDPKLGTGASSFKNVPPPAIDQDGNPSTPPTPAPIYCSGQTLLPSGELLLTGGNLIEPNASSSDPYTKYAGRNQVLTFDPWSETWTTQAQMLKGRWYPSQTLLPDGRTVITGGYTEDAPGAVITNLVEQYTPASLVGGQGTVARINGADRMTNLYPRTFLLPDGDVFMAGPGQFHVAKLRTASSGSGAWTGLSSQAPLKHAHLAGSAVLRGGGPNGSWQVTSIGGHSHIAAPDGSMQATTTVETLDVRTPATGWKQNAGLQVPRAHHNTVLLPDGSMVTIGGGVGATKADGNWAVDPAAPQRQVEIFDPATETWRLGAAQVEDRAYHSTALLLPDGRVWSAGDDHNPKAGGAISSFDTAEIWTPPYLYKGTRPRVRTHPKAVRWGDEFTIRAYPDGAAPVKAVLMAPGTVTHGFDMGQRRVELEVTQAWDGDKIKVKAPPTGAIAPPGYYMLHLLSADGVPSGAPWIKLDPSAPDAP